MGFSSLIQLPDALATPVTRDFDLVNTSGSTTTRIMTGTSLAEPLSMMIRHQEAKQRSAVSDRHAVSFKRVRLDPATLQAYYQLVTITLEQPRLSLFTVADMLDLVAFGRNFMPVTSPAANVNGILLGKS